jgi:formylglycine-generating enzyme required for sulfatase activity
MKRFLFILLSLTLLVSLAACGGSDDKGTDEASSGGNDTSAAEATPIVLATPTPKPAPATPTPKPTATEMPTAEPAPTTENADGTAPTAEPPTAVPMPALVDDMVLIPAGPFTMGNDGGDAEDAPAQTIDLPAFEMDKFEVSNDDFALFVDSTGYVTDAENSGSHSWQEYAEGKGNHPVVKVTWNDAVAFCEWAGKRLPTEQEWEKAARGDDARTYPWGNDFDASLANVKDTGLRGTTASGSFPGGASPYGVEDIAGNVWEWTASWFKAYDGGANDNPYYGERFRVTRGGAWFEEAAQVTTYNRNAADPDITANDDLGFRCVRDAQ